MKDREVILAEEGACFPGKTYTEVVLAPAYDEAKEHLLEPMMAINKAHLIMLYEQNLISKEEAITIARAIQKLNMEHLQNSSYTGEYEDLFFHVENLLLEQAGDIAGNLHLARSRNDMCVTMFRMVMRDKLLKVLSSALVLKKQLLAFAEEHVNTLMIAHTHTQQAQPTTLAHYIMAVVDSLTRDIRRLQAAYQNCNRSSMGAAAITTSGFPISRERVMQLLGFEELVENSYDAIAGADYLGEAATAIQLAAINLGRVVQDFLLWCTQEFSVFKVSEPYVQTSSIMPQKRNPVSFEHMRSLLSSCVGNTQSVLSMLHNTPFGDIVDTEDDMQPYAWKSAELLEKIYRLLTCVMGTLEVNEEILAKRAESSFATVTELADTLVRTDSLSFRKAHHIVSKVVKKAIAEGLQANEINLSMLNEVAQEVIGRSLYMDEMTLERALDPAHFIEIRSLPGGPSPSEMRRLIADRQKQCTLLAEWLEEKEKRWEQARIHLDQVLKGWSVEE
ncbi:argininosuccinate lyase [Thermoflavimicrobium dichotomicum]|uniref:Argininosuccinate lyase n=1 Tax=Thermoflavimicrobium dichotomicum TaxID=46223 RepID=A0A1I3TE57_9BACL|nr:argininosuccinate lyase [Thermoflavimicrobium dichotomicum]SFJ69448.1 argininosuccinate lyase [Thermoflavimicrobium dichotomicum]